MNWYPMFRNWQRKKTIGIYHYHITKIETNHWIWISARGNGHGTNMGFQVRGVILNVENRQTLSKPTFMRWTTPVTASHSEAQGRIASEPQHLYCRRRWPTSLLSLRPRVEKSTDQPSTEVHREHLGVGCRRTSSTTQFYASGRHLKHIQTTGDGALWLFRVIISTWKSWMVWLG